MVPWDAVVLGQTESSSVWKTSSKFAPLELLEDELEDEELELLLELELDEELLLEEEELLEFASLQSGSIKLPSWVPWKPNALLTVAPGAGSWKPQQLLNRYVVPGVPFGGLDGSGIALKLPDSVTGSRKFSSTVQPLSGVVPELVICTSVWKDVLLLKVAVVVVQASAAYA